MASGSTYPHLKKETALLRQGFRFVAGLDEAGRGSWAGPVVASAVILPVDQPGLADTLAGLNDSKKLTPAKREQLFSVIQQTAVACAVGIASAADVDQLNVVGATRLAMRVALQELTVTPDYLLLDHLRLPTVDLPQDAFPKADSISLSVAAASVLAKVTRDRLLVDLHGSYPAYGFDRHKGYGTKIHRVALFQHGPCPHHRMSYQPVKEAAEATAA